MIVIFFVTFLFFSLSLHIVYVEKMHEMNTYIMDSWWFIAESPFSRKFCISVENAEMPISLEKIHFSTHWERKKKYCSLMDFELIKMSNGILFFFLPIFQTSSTFRRDPKWDWNPMCMRKQFNEHIHTCLCISTMVVVVKWYLASNDAVMVQCVTNFRYCYWVIVHNRSTHWRQHCIRIAFMAKSSTEWTFFFFFSLFLSFSSQLFFIEI